MIKTHWLKQLQLAFGVPARRRKSSRSCESALESRTLLSGGACVELPVEEVSAEEPLVDAEGEAGAEKFVDSAQDAETEEVDFDDSVRLDENGEPLPEGAWLRHTVAIDDGDAVNAEEGDVVAYGEVDLYFYDLPPDSGEYQLPELGYDPANPDNPFGLPTEDAPVDGELNPDVMFYNMAEGVETPTEVMMTDTSEPTLEELIKSNGQIPSDENGNVTLQLEPVLEETVFKDPSSEYTGELPRGVWVLTSDVPPTEPEAPTETVVDAEVDPLIDSSGIGPVFNFGNQSEEVIQTTDAGPTDSVVIENGTPEESPVETPVDSQVDPSIDPVIYYNTAGGGRGGEGEILPNYRGGNAQAARAARQQAALIRKQERVAQQAERKLAAQNRKAARAVQLAAVRATRSTAKAARRTARHRSR